MVQGQINTSSEGLDKIGIERAAKNLRDRLAFATMKANENGSISVQSLKDIIPLSPMSSTIITPFPVASSPSTVHSIGDFNVGLGLDLDESASNIVDEKMSTQRLPSKPSNTGSPREPSLYDAIFGPAYSKIASRHPTTPPKSKIRPLQGLSLSPHVRQGSSAQLEKVASSPRLNQSPTWRHQPLSHSATAITTLTTSAHRRSDSFAYPHSSPSKQRRESTGGAVQVSFTTPPSRNRMRSAGGSLLPNGHPASSLAQDLGIASGSTPRSRNASRDFGLLGADRRYHHSEEYHHHHRHSQAETDRVAGLLTSMSNNQHRSEKSITPPSTTFADPNVVTPRRTRRRSKGGEVDGNEAAAHSLLDLAASPSPNHGLHQQERFPGATPSLDRMLVESRVTADLPRRLMDEVEQDQGRHNWSSRRMSHFSTLPTDHLPSLKTLKQMVSPPMTPPRSIKREKLAFDPDSEDSSPCPTTPTRKGQMTLLSDEKSEYDKETLDLGESVHTTMNHQHESHNPTETPRTPPPISAPSTPKAPGSNFCYGEFLHVSPSPQPRVRVNSYNGTPRMGTLQGTPTRGTKSQARFINYGCLDMSEATPLTDLEMGDILTPGKHKLLSSPQVGVKKAKLYAD